jgi:hypothetical protein
MSEKVDELFRDASFRTHFFGVTLGQFIVIILFFLIIYFYNISTIFVVSLIYLFFK